MCAHIDKQNRVCYDTIEIRMHMGARRKAGRPFSRFGRRRFCYPFPPLGRVIPGVWGAAGMGSEARGNVRARIV